MEYPKNHWVIHDEGKFHDKSICREESREGDMVNLTIVEWIGVANQEARRDGIGYKFSLPKEKVKTGYKHGAFWDYFCFVIKSFVPGKYIKDENDYRMLYHVVPFNLLVYRIQLNDGILNDEAVESIFQNWSKTYYLYDHYRNGSFFFTDYPETHIDDDVNRRLTPMEALSIFGIKLLDTVYEENGVTVDRSYLRDSALDRLLS